MTDKRDGSGPGLAYLLHKWAIPILSCLAVGALAITIMYIRHTQSDLLRTNAVRNASLYAQALTEFRTLYTAKVVNRVKSKGIDIVHDYESREGAIPLPATLTMELGQSIGKHQSGAAAKLYSPFPFPWRTATGGLQDDFAKEAWAHLSIDRETPFYRFETRDNRLFLRYATADVMRAECVDCHNSHDQSPKGEWQAGDVRGVLEIVHPLDQIVASTNASLVGTSVVLALLVGLTLLSLGLVTASYRRSSIELEDRVRRRTAALTASEARTSSIMSAAADGIIAIDEHGTVESYNAAARTIFGHEPEEVIGHNVKMLMPSPDHENHDAYLRRFLEGGARKIIGNRREVMGRRQDGSTFPMELHVSQVFAGRHQTFIAIIRDITSRELAEDVLRAEKDYIDNIVRSMVNMLIVVTPDGKIVKVNDAVCRTLGYDTQELTGQSASLLFRAEEDDDDGTDCSLAREALPLKTGALRQLVDVGSISNLEQSLLAKDGSVIHVRTSGSVMRAIDGRIVGIICVSEDVTEHRRAELERKRLETQLAHAQKLESVGQLAAGIAHEINTPAQYVGDNTRFLKDAFSDVAKVLQASDQLLETVQNGSASAELAVNLDTVIEEADLSYLKEEIPRAIEETLEGIERVTKIVRAMKEFSHPGGKEKTRTDLNRAIDSTITVATNEWKYAAEMVKDYDAGLPLVPCHPSELNQVILNLIVNAAHSIGDVIGDGADGKGTIKVSTSLDGEWAEIRVSDTGTGIPEEIRHRIFDPFFTTKAIGTGSGQGLSIAHGVVTNKHGGTIAFESEIGKGTTFTIRLPLIANAVPVEDING